MDTPDQEFMFEDADVRGNYFFDRVCVRPEAVSDGKRLDHRVAESVGGERLENISAMMYFFGAFPHFEIRVRGDEHYPREGEMFENFLRGLYSVVISPEPDVVVARNLSRENPQ
jgi:hypothetical protein